MRLCLLRQWPKDEYGAAEENFLKKLFPIFTLQIPNSLGDSQNETLITHNEKKKQKPR